MQLQIRRKKHRFPLFSCRFANAQNNYYLLWKTKIDDVTPARDPALREPKAGIQSEKAGFPSLLSQG